MSPKRTSVAHPFGEFFPTEAPRENPASQAATCAKGAKRLFNEGLTVYLRAMRQQNLLTAEDRQLLLIAIHGLTRLQNYPLARALIRLCFAELTADELLTYLERARCAASDVTYEVPF